MRRGAALLAIASALAGGSASAEVENPSLLREGGFGATAAVISMGYAPLKLAYAISGLVLGTGSLLWTWGDQEVAKTLWTKSMGGDYVVTPDHLGGIDELRFTGR